MTGTEWSGLNGEQDEKVVERLLVTADAERHGAEKSKGADVERSPGCCRCCVLLSGRMIWSRSLMTGEEGMGV
jgi:hypothetical protein